jgi:hypothetical protein
MAVNNLRSRRPVLIACGGVVLGVILASLETFVWEFPSEYNIAVWACYFGAMTATVAAALVPRWSAWLLGVAILPFLQLFLVMFLGLFWWPIHLLPAGIIAFAALKAGTPLQREPDEQGTQYLR